MAHGRTLMTKVLALLYKSNKTFLEKSFMACRDRHLLQIREGGDATIIWRMYGEDNKYYEWRRLIES